MTRRQFTINVAKLINKMVEDGHEPIMDYVLRSADEQKRLFDKGYSKCDGTTKISPHQRGKAVDIYFFIDDNVDYGYEQTRELAIKYHDYWVSLGGNPMIEFKLGDNVIVDYPHYEC